MSKVIVPLSVVRGELKCPDMTLMYLALWIKSKAGVVEGITKKELGKLLGFHEDRVSKIIGGLKISGFVLATRQGRKGNKYILPRKKTFYTRPGNFTLLDRRVFFNKKLPPKARLLHATIHSFQYKNKVAKLNHKHLAKLVGFSVRSISRYLLLLRKVGLVKMYRRKYLSNMYHVSNEYKEFTYRPARVLGERGGNDRVPHNVKDNTTQLEQDIRFERYWEEAYRDMS